MKSIFLVILFTLAMMVAACSPPVTQVAETPDNNQSQFLISLSKDLWLAHFPNLDGEVNIFQTNQDGSTLQPIVTGLSGYNFVLQLSPDNKKILVASYDLTKPITPSLTGQLYAVNVDGSSVVLLSDNLPYRPSPVTSGTLWLSNDKVAFISGALGYTHIHSINADGSDEIKHTALNQYNQRLTPFRLLAFRGGKELYWQNGQIDLETAEISLFPLRSELDGTNLISIQTKDATTPQWEIAPSGDLIAWGADILTSNFGIVDQLDLNYEPRRSYWSPKGDMLLVQTCSQPNCSETITYYLWRHTTPSFQGFPVNTALQKLISVPIHSKIEWAIWSPDQEEILLHFEEDQTNGIESPYQILTLETLKIYPIFKELHLDSTSPSYIQWLQKEPK